MASWGKAVPKFWAVGKLSENFRPKMQNLGLKTPFWENLRAKLKCDHTSLLSEIQQLPVVQLQPPVPPTILTQDAADQEVAVADRHRLATYHNKHC